MVSDLRTYLELLYFASGIVVAVAVALGLQQIRLLKKDMRIRNERAAKERAIEYGRLYLTAFISSANKAYAALEKANLSTHDEPVGDFSASPTRTPQQLERTAKRLVNPFLLDALNHLESIAASFVTGVADESTGFKICGRSFCGSVESYYDVIAACRNKKNAVAYWNNIVALYGMWSPRLSQAELRKEKERLEAKLAATAPSSEVPPIGVV
jgi:hypothetical protein